MKTYSDIGQFCFSALITALKTINMKQRTFQNIQALVYYPLNFSHDDNCDDKI